ncbi:MAG: U32 family peptidase [Mollicutes bacterium]|jgi:putative protease|nr:U32 family peptidase [Mollicutes bacterium]
MKYELLSPAGNLEKLKVAIDYGADAVYIGGKNYSLRANANNFSLDEIKEAVTYAHKFNKKVYVTVNIVFHDNDLLGLDDYLKYLADIKVDGIIFSDHAVISLVKKLKLDLNLILSTQTSTLNKYAALYWQDLGVSRIVLAREALIEDLQSIIDTGLETEVFIHGAMCTSFSGKCVMSNYVTNRDSNRGGCAQICRFLFDNSENNPKFTMMSKDLNMLLNLESMIDMGVTSFKIEGRMRSIYYIATVIHTYRQVIDKILNKTLTTEYLTYANNILGRVANRESAPQFFQNIPGVEGQYFQDRNEISNQDFLGLVLDYKDGYVSVEQRNYFKPGDDVEFFGPKTNEESLKVGKIYDENLKPLEVANQPGKVIKFKSPIPLFKGDIMRVKVFDKVE